MAYKIRIRVYQNIHINLNPNFLTLLVIMFSQIAQFRDT